MNTTLRYVSIFFIWLIASSALLAEDQSECYLAIENPDKIEPKIVESLSKSLLSKYVETVQSIPRAGISQDECLYQVAVKKSMDTILITISGRNLNGIGDSKSSGFDGVQQAFIKALFHGSQEKRGELCRDFDKKLGSACEHIAVSAVQQKAIPKVVLPRKAEGIPTGLCSYPEANKDYRHCDLERKKFKGANLRGAIFAGINLERADFSGCDLTGTDFAGADLERAVFKGATIVNADFTGANLARAIFKQAMISNVSLEKANLERAKFIGAALQQVNLSGAHLEKAQFKGASIKVVDFSHAEMADARFKGASLAGVNLTGADLEDVDFSKTSLEDIIR